MKEQVFPEPTVGAMIFNENGEIFLMKSHKWRGKYVIPGGHIELGESMKDALKREIKEETNLEIYDIDFLHWQEFIFDELFYKKRHFVFFNFTAKTDSENVKLNDEGQEFIWVKPEESLKLPVEPYTVKAIEKYLEKK
ncbi:NUDIX domain-containing protein [Candidatus Woesearchaeota archaeon]|nr:NUDIX domain-containing protein [Candidatus Woesearchaeota archaeon]